MKPLSLVVTGASSSFFPAEFGLRYPGINHRPCFQFLYREESVVLILFEVRLGLLDNLVGDLPCNGLIVVEIKFKGSGAAG